MTQPETAMPDVIYAGMLDSGSTYWCSHPVRESAKIVGAKNAKGYEEAEYHLSTPDTITLTKTDFQEMVGALEKADKKLMGFDLKASVMNLGSLIKVTDAWKYIREALAIAAKYTKDGE